MTTLKSNFVTEPEVTRPSRLAHIQSPGRILVAGLGLGIVADVLVFGKPLGMGLLLFVLLAVAVLWRVNRGEGVTAVRPNLWLLLPLFFFAGMVAVRANATLTTLNTLAVLCLLAYLVFFWGRGRVQNLGLVDMGLLPLRVSGHALTLTPPIVAESVDMEAVQRHGRRSFFPVLRGLLLAAPMLLVFTALLAMADTIFAHTVETAFSLDIFAHLFNWAGHGLMIGLAAWLLTGGLAYGAMRRYGRDDQSRFEATLQQIPRHFSLGYIETITLLVTVNLLFLMFVLIQFTYLFGSVVYIQLENFSYAEYARRGFFELLLVVILSIGLILGLNWLTRRESKRQIKLFNGLSTLLIGLVLVMLASAFRRMVLYEAQFGYTELRLMVYVFVGWLAPLLAWFAVTLWRRPDRFALGVLAAALGFLVTLNLLNPDAFIARQNLARYIATGDLDAVYLTSLSDDATPYLLAALLLTAGDTQEQTMPSCYDPLSRVMPIDCYAVPYEIVKGELHGRVQSMSENGDWRQWQSFHLARWQAFAQLQEIGD
ncbi:MAG: DUF4173 domain-containing protein [Anaerolineae bacterium]|nr:DUF4173 domain-containing protein [Anaerolineae bacterium]